MSKQNKAIMLILHVIMLAAVFIMLYCSMGYINPGPRIEGVKYIRSVEIKIADGPEERIILPHRFRKLPPRTPVTVTAVIHPDPDEEIYVESQYCPAKVYLDGVLGYEFGAPGQYPDFMLDPATEVHMIETHGTGKPMILRMDMLSPITQKRMTLEPPLLGSTKEIILERLHSFGLPCILAAAQIIYGISLLFIYACVQFIDKKGVSFLWLGLLSLTTGMWAFGESDFSGVVCKNTTFLYLCSFAGFFTFIVPLLRFSRAIVDYENPKPLWYLEMVMVFSASAAMVLQLLGQVSCTSSMHYFYVVLPLSMVFLTGYTIREAILHGNSSARRYILPVGILTLTSVVGFFCYLYSASYTVSSMTQLGILIFLLLVGVTAGLSFKDSMELRNKQKELAFQQDLMEIQIKEQKTHSLLLSQHEELLSQQRHDLRHHLNAILALTKKENIELRNYLQSLMDNIPQSQKVFCRNQAVNAILAHYDALCDQKRIQLNLNVGIDEENPSLNDSSLCIIFGNLLENAVEACDRMNSGKKFITLNTRVQYDLLTIAMDNSFNGIVRIEDGRFRSSKRDNFGIGLSSVRSMAQRAGGDAEFHAEGNVFMSSVFVRL